MKVDTLKKMSDRAKIKKDGIYACDGHTYTVKNGRPHRYIENNTIYEIHGGFVISISNQFEYKFQAVDALKKDKLK